MYDVHPRIIPPLAVLEHSGGTVSLPLGTIFLGRGEGCLLRIEDPSVSRLHVAIEVTDRVVARDLGSRNGTLLNGERLQGRHELTDGDLLTLGRRSVRVRVVPADPDAAADETPPLRSGTLAGVGQIALDQQCPVCKAEVSAEETTCPRCAHRWPRAPATSPTDAVNAAVTGVRPEDRRAHPRHAVDIAVHYRSAELRFAARAGDLSRGGVFVATDRFDSAGTACEVEFFPRQLASTTFRGHVCRVVRRGVDGASGMAVQFDDVTEEQVRWLATLRLAQLRGHAEPLQ